MYNSVSFEWILPEDLVITTGFVFKDAPALQRQTIKELSESNCSALAVKPRKYFGSMPEALVEAADEFGLPLLEIPITMTLSDVSHQVNRVLVEEQESLIQKTLHIHEKLTEISLSGGSIQEITQEVAGVIENPVLVVSDEWDLLTFQEHEDNPYPLKQYIQLERDQTLFTERFKKDIPNDARSFKKSIKRKINVGKEEIICRVIPIKAIEEILGYIVVWETVSKMTKLDYVVIEKASMNMAFDLLKQKEVNEVKNKIRFNFFDD